MDNTSLTGHKLNSLNTLCILQNEDEKQVSGSDFYHRIYRRQFVKRRQVIFLAHGSCSNFIKRKYRISIAYTRYPMLMLVKSSCTFIENIFRYIACYSIVSNVWGET